MIGYERKGEWLEFRLPKGEPPGSANPAELAAKYIPLPHKLSAKLAKKGDIRAVGGRMRIRLFPVEPGGFPPEWMDLNVLYEDDFCLVADKPAGVAVHPAHPGQSGTLANAVAAYYESTGQFHAVRHIHRLDEDTTGPVLYAKNEYAHLLLDEAMRRKAIGRIYLAVVRGRLRNDAGTIDAPIGRDRHHNRRRRVSATGDPAVTHFEAVERFPDATLVRLRLETGRTHQIRVHLSHIGHPIYGDALYGGPMRFITRQALHGEELRFPHPLSRETVSVRSPLPEDMRRLIGRLSLLSGSN